MARQGASGRLQIHRAFAIATLALGICLMALMIHADSEPGAIPLGFVLVGSAWWLVTQARIRAHRSPEA